MSLAWLDKLRGQLATQIVHFFRLAVRKGHFATKAPVFQRFAFRLTIAHSGSLCHFDSGSL